MPTDNLNEREFELINIVGANLGANQRNLSQLMNLSLGMTNMLIRRLISKGYIRIKQLNKKKVEYMLTPKGFSEKVQKSIKYTLKTIHSISLIKNHTKDIILKSYEKGERDFYVLGSSDLAALIEMAIRDTHLENYKISHIKELPRNKMEGLVLICQEDVRVDPGYPNKTVNVLNELGQNGILTG